jgi:hypothetical protein
VYLSLSGAIKVLLTLKGIAIIVVEAEPGNSSTCPFLTKKRWSKYLHVAHGNMGWFFMHPRHQHHIAPKLTVPAETCIMSQSSSNDFFLISVQHVVLLRT